MWKNHVEDEGEGGFPLGFAACLVVRPRCTHSSCEGKIPGFVLHCPAFTRFCPWVLFLFFIFMLFYTLEKLRGSKHHRDGRMKESVKDEPFAIPFLPVPICSFDIALGP